ncbi:MAG TPA: ribosomal protein S18-alanine N-acetyltransferase [Burkholderiales bacterium]|nr:ribosomal protein S18-alanine N-acetyltransferase [Burkholderiales bacterium]
MSAQLAESTLYARMAESDLDEVAAIEQAVHAHPWTRGNFADSLSAGYHCWVARRDGKLVAYAVVLIAAGEAHLLNLSVAAAWQRRGLGAELTRFIVKLARDYGAASIYLEVRPSNTAARALYAAAGFTEIGLRRDYYPAENGREDAVIMERRLT